MAFVKAFLAIITFIIRAALIAWASAWLLDGAFKMTFAQAALVYLVLDAVFSNGAFYTYHLYSTFGEERKEEFRLQYAVIEFLLGLASVFAVGIAYVVTQVIA